MRDKIIGFIISVVCFIISFGFVKGQAMALPFVPTDWTWEMYQGLHMLGDLIANDVNFDVPDWVDFNDFDDVKLFLENIYNEGKKKVAYASIIADLCVGTWEHFLATGEVDLAFSEQNIKRVHNTGFFQHIADTINIENYIPSPDPNYTSYINTINGTGFYFGNYQQIHDDTYNIDYYMHYPLTQFSFNMSGNNFINYVATSILTIDVTGSDSDGWTVSEVSYPYWKYFFWRSTPNYCSASGRIYPNDNPPCIHGQGSPSGYDPNAIGTQSWNPSTFSNLDYAFQSIAYDWRNVNIRVNGQIWAWIGDTTYIDNPLGVVIPDNTIDDIQVGDTKGHLISATLPDTDNLVGSIDLGVVMDELREAQAEGRQASLEKVKTKEGVKAIDGTVVDTKSKAVAIDVPVVTSVVASADDFGYIPYYPEIPSAFSGTTILSELIDATQTIVPNDLIMAIWGLVIILFIIALINIFHK